MTGPVRPRKQAAVLPPDLDTGDTVEFGMTVECRPKGSGTIWVKAGATVHVRVGETPERASERASVFVMEQVSTQVAELMA